MYASAFKRVWAHAEDTKASLFGWGEGEMMGMLIKLEKEGAAENMLKQVMAVVGLVFEVMGRGSPTKSELVLKVKKTCIKRGNKRKVVRSGQFWVGCTLGDVKKMIEDIYVSPASEVDPCRRRFLVTQLFLFFGVKRFSDIATLKVKDVSFKTDGSLEVFFRKSKTDQVGRGASFFLSGKKVGGVFLPEMVRWYVGGLGLKGEEMLFPRMRHSKGEVVPIKRLAVSYGSAAGQLKAKVKRLGLGNISLHSGRIGAATAGAMAGISREHLKACGGWKSDAVNLYIQVDKPGIAFSGKMLRRL